MYDCVCGKNHICNFSVKSICSHKIAFFWNARLINEDHQPFYYCQKMLLIYFHLYFLQGLLLLFVILDICGCSKLISNGVNERNVNFIDDPSNVAIDFSRKVTFQSTKVNWCLILLKLIGNYKVHYRNENGFFLDWNVIFRWI